MTRLCSLSITGLSISLQEGLHKIHVDEQRKLIQCRCLARQSCAINCLNLAIVILQGRSAINVFSCGRCHFLLFAAVLILASFCILIEFYMYRLAEVKFTGLNFWMAVNERSLFSKQISCFTVANPTAMESIVRQ